MGLDMHLYATDYISSYSHSSEEETEKFKALLNLFHASDFVEEHRPHAEVRISVGYWRKANAIHRWFVNNVQEGVDDCKLYYVSRDDLKKLKEQCELAKKISSEALPTQSGFFFGGTDYDEWYYKNLDYTIELVDKCLKMPDEFEFGYRSSW